MNTYVVFLTPKGSGSTFVERIYLALLRLHNKGRKSRYSHVGVMVDELVTHVTWEGIQTVHVSSFLSNYKVTKLYVPFNDEQLETVAFFMEQFNYSIRLSDLLRCLCGQPAKQFVCTDFVSYLLNRDERISFVSRQRALTSDELYDELTRNDYPKNTATVLDAAGEGRQCAS